MTQQDMIEVLKAVGFFMMLAALIWLAMAWAM